MGKTDVTAFCEAVWRRDAKALAALGRRVDPNALDRWKRTPLLMAAQFGDVALVALLVGRGGDVDQNRRHLTPVTLAARRGDLAIVRFLRDRGATMSPVTWVYLHDWQQLELALARDPAVAHLRDELGTPILHHAAETLAPELVVLLLERGANVTEPDENGETALHRVADMLPREPEAAARMATLLVDRGADPNARNWDDVTPLHQGVRRRNLAVVEVLQRTHAAARAPPARARLHSRWMRTGNAGVLRGLDIAGSLDIFARLDPPGPLGPLD